MHSGRPADDNPFAGRVPKEGSIVLRDPHPAGRLPNGARPQPINIVLTTESSKGHAPDAPVGVNAGTIPEDAPKDRPSLGAAKKILAAEKKSTTTVISSQKFQELWKTLDEADVFSLPRFRGGIPPDDRPSITLTGDGRSFTFLRPGDPLGGAVPTGEAEKTRMANAWTNVKSIIGSSLGRL